MAVINDPKPVTRKQLERELADAKKALQAARMALLDPNPDVNDLAAKRDETEVRRMELHKRRLELRSLEFQLRGFLGPIEQEHDPELVAEMKRIRREHEDMNHDIEEADRVALNALRAYNAAERTHAARRSSCVRLEQLVLSLERELQRVDPRATVRARSWRDLIQLK